METNTYFLSQRSFAEMSHQSTLSPSPSLFRDSPSAFARLASAAPSNNPSRNTPSLFENRRRTSHPHNQSLHPSPRLSQDMAEVSQAQRPRLEHRASQTIIDLTDDPEEPSLFLPRNNRDRSRSQRPPQLGRSDASGLMEFIDLTEDNVEPDLVITGDRVLPRPPAARPPPAAPAASRIFGISGHDSPVVFIPRDAAPQNQPAINRVFASMQDGVHAVGAALGLAMPARQGARPAAHHDHYHFHPLEPYHMGHHVHIMNQAMPGAMDYRHPAFADRKAEHVPPKAAIKGFTRSPTEDMVIICPSCQDELVHNKEVEEPVVKKSGKAPTRKEREEHPFWVVKECGHVSQLSAHPGPFY